MRKLILMGVMGVIGVMGARGQTVTREAGANFARYSSTNGSPTNMWQATTNAAKVYDITVFNTGATDLYLLVFDSKTNQLVNTAPSITPVKVLAGASTSMFWMGGRNFRRGVTLATSTTPATLTNSAAVFLIDVTYYDSDF